MNYIHLNVIKLKRYIIILVLISLFANPVIGIKLSKTAPYSDIPAQGIPNWGGKDLEFIQAGHNDRIRQNGTIYQIRFAVANASRLKQFNFTIWRQNGSNYDRIATTNNLINNISTGINVINLSTPIKGIREGDFYGYRVKSSSNALYVNPGVTNHLTYSVVGGANSKTKYNWNAQVISANVFVIEPYMEHPYMVFIGDSIMSGWPGHLSFIQSSNIINIYSSIENHWARKVNKSYQNMGYAGDMTGQLNSRFNSDVVNLFPEFALIEGGINDINSNQGYSRQTILANWESMVKKAHYNNIIPVVMLILPDSRKSDAVARNITYINEQLIKLGANYSPSIIVDARCYIGVNRLSGPAGNCWTINPSYTTDGLHYNSAGNERIAQAIKDSFTLPDVISPNGGENWQRGTIQTIRWNYIGSPGTNVKIELIKGGVASIINSITPNDGSYSWTISSTQALGTDYKIRITSTTNSAYTDTSNNNFTISLVTPTITVVSPNGGENWVRGTTKTITWTSSGSPGTNVKIELIKGGVATIINSSTPNDGSHSWTIPSTQTLGTDYMIRIRSTTNSAYTDSSNNNFTISTGITVASPNGGENWIKGTTKTIIWTSSGSPGTNVKIELIKGGVPTIINSSTPNDGSHNWTIPSTQTTGSIYKVRVTSTTNSAYTDTSNNNFTISSTPSITVISPNGGENWVRGTTKTITWTSSGSPGTNVKIELLKSGVASIVNSSTPNDGSHSWTIPSTQTTGSNYKVRVTSTTNSAYTDTSNNNFTISI